MPWFQSRRGTPTLAIPTVPRTTTYIEEGCSLNGQLQFQSGVRIDGRVEGEVRARGTVVVGETAVVEASILADIVVVLGEVAGEIEATTLVALHKGASVRSDIRAAGIVVEPGANFRGSIVIGGIEETTALGEQAGETTGPFGLEPGELEEEGPVVRIQTPGVVGAGNGSIEHLEFDE